MPRIITAMFKDHFKAQQALQALLGMGLARDRVTALGVNPGREVSSISGFRTLEIQPEARSSLRGLELPEEDLDLFERGLQRGHSLIAARIDREDHEKAIQVLEMFDPADLDRDSREWTSHEGGGPEALQGTGDVGKPLGGGITGGNAEGMSNTGSLPGMGTMIDNGTSLGTGDLNTDETARSATGFSSTVPTGQYDDGRREERPGVNELRRDSTPPAPRSGPFQRDMNRGGRIRIYLSD
ncbi:hypothetical protein [Microvirga roseola]|uniref:hypothetical protein n=1 Tax=Microvirga roseola TaxID=2883126 RepID=UPI001E4CE93B|nr:hypothetical protein [Microvirga roseola]